MERLLLASVASLILMSGVAYSFDCKSECSPGGPNCLLVTNKIPDVAVKSGLGWLREQLSKKEDIIIKRENLLKEFAITADPCNRLDTTISASGRIVNTGGECKVGGAMQLPDGELSAYILVPSKLELDYSIVGNLIQIEPVIAANASATSMPVALFSSESLQEDWGGVIKRVWFSDNHSILETRSCIRFNY